MKLRPLSSLFLAGTIAGVVSATTWIVLDHDRWMEKRVKVIVPGQLVRGAWQGPGPLRRIVEREKIRTVVTLTAINSTDRKFTGQEQVLRERGVRWMIIPMRGSRATPEQMALAADLLADPEAQPVFFHCVAGHHRTSLAHAAYLIRHAGYTADQAWKEISTLPWSRPDSVVDRNDRFLIEEFARMQSSLIPSRERGVWEMGNGSWSQAADPPVHPADRGGLAGPGGLDRLESGDAQLRGDPSRAALPIRADVPGRAGPGSS
ncbi:hypothetical protein OJF2_16080 [Aquisphaera giovannonii]|uniref:Tyrosine phosphatase family protein n=1 Tax=Aquisphaera giovannonii TaxID=406548 RepID=A0A5B9VYT8_9BACT|nr:hypothetical protein [Aquisphaera giovannonii]QEH33111.1 hypothetical protein OJF2_16080 [Aquisphaera giovannonii]